MIFSIEQLDYQKLSLFTQNQIIKYKLNTSENEIMQTMYLNFIKYLEDYNKPIKNYNAFAISIINNIIKDILKSKTQIVTSLAFDENIDNVNYFIGKIPAPDTFNRNAEYCLFLYNILNKIPYNYKNLLCEAYGAYGYYKYTQNELAEKYRVSQSTISKKLKEFRQFIRIHYMQYYYNLLMELNVKSYTR